MNIHFSDEKLYEDLIKRTIIKAPIGSRFYGDFRPDSDYDYLNIYVPDICELTSPFTNHHQLQFKKIGEDGTGIDENFTSVTQFFRNLVSGDNTINFEVLFTEQFKNVFHSLSYKDFYTYNIAKAYLGFAKRDLKFMDQKNEDRERHVVRGLQLAFLIMEKRNIEKFVFRNSWAARLFVVEDQLRRELNNKLEKKQIDRFLKPDVQRKISEKVSDIFGKKYSKIAMDSLEYYYQTNENPYLKYD